MGWVNDQIRERMESDQEIFEESFVRVAGAVLGSHVAERLEDERQVAKAALSEILKYYRFKAVEVPDSVSDINEQIEYVLRPTGLMTRNVRLEEGWYKNAFGPMLGYLNDGTAVALLPGRISGYWFKDPNTGKRTRVGRKTAQMFDEDAMCFYRPLPMKKLGIPDLLIFMQKCITRGDLILIALATLAVNLVCMIEPKLYAGITGPVLKSRNVSLLIGMAIFLLSSNLASQMIEAVRSLLMDRISVKTSLAVEASVMMRILSLPVSFFRKYSSGELSNRANSVDSLCTMLLDNILSTGLTSLMSLLFITQIFQFAPTLVWPSIAIILATVLLSLFASMMQIGISRKEMQISARESGMSYAMVGGIQKIRLAGAEKRAFARWAKLYAENTELQYNPPAFLKLNGVILKGISLVGTIVLYTLAVKTGVEPSSYFGFTAAYGHLLSAFSSLAGIAKSSDAPTD